jgi:hypothetical protein
MGARREGAADHWQDGSVTPADHNLRRQKSAESRSEQRLADPKAPHRPPSGRELWRAKEREADSPDE